MWAETEEKGTKKTPKPKNPISRTFPQQQLQLTVSAGQFDGNRTCRWDLNERPRIHKVCVWGGGFNAEIRRFLQCNVFDFITCESSLLAS